MTTRKRPWEDSLKKIMKYNPKQVITKSRVMSISHIDDLVITTDRTKVDFK